MNKFSAKDKPLEEVLFTLTRKYRVPRYQRPYAWDTPEITDLWEDILTNAAPHFVGSVIFNSAIEETEGYLDIIDGQQRLLTITILLAALRDNVKALDPELARRIQEQDIALVDRSGKHTYRILPADTLADFFQKNIQSDSDQITKSDPTSDETGKVKRAYEFFDAQIKLDLKRHSSNEAKIATIELLRSRIAGLIVICIDITGEDDAYEIFETTNANRVELSVADLLKNLVFRKLPPDKDKDFAKDLWQDMAKDIEGTGTDLKKFIRYYWISKYEFISEKSLYRAIKKTITNHKEFLFELADSTMWWVNMLDGTDQDFASLKNSVRIYNSVRAIRSMRVSQCYAFLLALFRNYAKLNVDVLRIVQFIERFTFQYSAVCKLPTNRVEKVYSRFAIKLEKLVVENKGPGGVTALFAELESELKEHAPSEQVFREGFLQIEYAHDDSARGLVKYILNKVNVDLSQTNEQLVNFGTVNIEHVLPQKPHADWKLKRKEIKGYVNKLGNLTLVANVINSSVQNYVIAQKLPELKKSQLPITKEIVGLLEEGSLTWGEAQIAKRHDELASRAYSRIWKL